MTPNRSRSLSRRTFLTSAAASTAATAGCVGRIRETLGGAGTSQLSLEVITLPADSDPFGVRIANHLQSHLEAVGISVRLRPESAESLSQRVLLNHDFDIYVGQFPYTKPPDPDVFYPMFRSTFASELGWQNPFGFTHLTCDDLLEAQRSSGGEQRQQDVDDLQQLLARTQPFTPIIFPDVLTGVRTDRFTGWNPEDRNSDLGGPTQPHNLLQLESVDDQPQTLRLVVVDDRITENRNPISAAYKQETSLLDLVYDSIAFDTGQKHVPWLARELSWDTGEGPPEVEIRLRDGLQWHDGKQLSAYDVGFTYDFLRDTSLGEAVRPIPSERFRGRVSLVDDVTVTNSRELSLTFTDTTKSVAQRALTVPILPAHIWRQRTEIKRPTNRAGQTTAALTSNNPSAIGSGPLQFDDAGGGEVVFSRFDAHFLWPTLTATPPENDGVNETGRNQSTELRLNDSIESSDDRPLNDTETGSDDRILNETEQLAGEQFDLLEAYAGPPAFDSVSVQTVSSPNAAIALLTAGDVDATATNLSPAAGAAVEDDSELELIENRSNAFYHLGFNTRRQPLGNPYVRRLIAQLVDKSTLAEEEFEGYGVPAASPLAETGWVADSLRWDTETNTDPEVPFIGSDGELAVEEARERFRSIGYQYNNDNELVTQIR